MPIRCSWTRTLVCASSVGSLILFVYIACVIVLPLSKKPRTGRMVVPSLPRPDSLDYDVFKHPDVDDYNALETRSSEDTISTTTGTSKEKEQNHVMVLIRKNSKWTRTNVCEKKFPIFQRSQESSVGKLTLYVGANKHSKTEGKGGQLGQMHFELLKSVHSWLAFVTNSVLIDIGSQDGRFSILAAKIGRRAITIQSRVDSVHGLCRSIEYANIQRFVTVIQSNSSSPDDQSYQDNILVIDEDITCATEGFSLDQLIDLEALEAQAKLLVYFQEYQHNVEAILMCANDLFIHFDVQAILMPWSGYNIRNKERLAEHISMFKMKPYEYSGVGKELLIRNVEYWPTYVLWKHVTGDL